MSRTTSPTVRIASSTLRTTAQPSSVALCAPVLRMLQTTASQWGMRWDAALSTATAHAHGAIVKGSAPTCTA